MKEQKSFDAINLNEHLISQIPASSLRHLWAQAKVAREQKHWPEAEGYYRQILTLTPKSKAANAGLGWVYFYWNNALLEEGGSKKSVAKRNLFKWLQLDNEKSGLAYGLMLIQAKRLADGGILKMHDFLKYWDLANLQPSHWEKTQGDKNIIFDSIGVQVIRVAAKEIVNLPNIASSEVSLTAEWVDMALDHDPENVWLIYYKGKLLLKLGRATEAVNYYKSVVRQKLHESWAWHYLAQAMKDSNDPMVLACECKAVAECDLQKSLKIRFKLVKLLMDEKHLAEAKALLEQIHGIVKPSSSNLPVEVQRIEKLSWYSQTPAANNIEEWIREQGEKALGILTTHLSWEPACVGASFINAKQKPRVAVILKDGHSIAVSPKAFGLLKMRKGEPIEIKKVTSPSGKTSILDLRKRTGDLWDIAKSAKAVVTGIDRKKKSIRFVGIVTGETDTPRSFFCPADVVKDKLSLGDAVHLQFIPGEKNFIFSAIRTNQPSPDRLLRKIYSSVDFIAPNRSFGKLDNGVFLSNYFLFCHKDVTKDSVVSGIAVPNFDHKKNVWGWMLLTVDTVENLN